MRHRLTANWRLPWRADTLKEPYVMACVNVVAANTDAEATSLATSLQRLFLGIVTGERKLLQPPIPTMDNVWNENEAAAVSQMLAYSFIGSASSIENKLDLFVKQTGVNEIMATSHIYDHQARVHSYKLFAKAIKNIATKSVVSGNLQKL